MSEVQSPIEHVSLLYAGFVQDQIEARRRQMPGSGYLSFSEKSNHEFNVFLEDVIINDPVLEQYSRDLKWHELDACIGFLLLNQTVYNYVIEHGVLLDWSVKGLCEAWYANIPSKVFLVQSLAKPFGIDGKGNYYRWDGKLWRQCQESDVVCNLSDRQLNLEPFTHDFTSLVVQAGKNWVSGKLKEYRTALATINDDTIRTHVRDFNHIELNQAPHELQCRSCIVNLEGKGKMAKAHDPKAYFSECLPYDLPLYTTDVTKQFVQSFDCFGKDLANALRRWGCRSEPTLTIIVGPPKSGKTALCQVAEKLYGPFATSRWSDHVYADYSMVRTCFLDDQALPDEELIATHPCRNLVFTCSKLNHPGLTFGGRKVFVLCLGSEIDPALQVPNIVTKMSTKTQLSSLLGLLLCCGPIDGVWYTSLPWFTTPSTDANSAPPWDLAELDKASSSVPKEMNAVLKNREACDICTSGCVLSKDSDIRDGYTTREIKSRHLICRIPKGDYGCMSPTPSPDATPVSSARDAVMPEEAHVESPVEQTTDKNVGDAQSVKPVKRTKIFRLGRHGAEEV